MHDLPEPNRAQRGVREPSEPELLLSASLRGLLRTRKTRTGLGPPAPPPPSARSPASPLAPLASPGLARGTRPEGAEGGTGCSVPSCLWSPCQPAALCLFSHLKGAPRRWKTSLRSRQKREKGAGKQSCLSGLRGGEEPVEKRNI